VLNPCYSSVLYSGSSVTVVILGCVSVGGFSNLMMYNILHSVLPPYQFNNIRIYVYSTGRFIHSFAVHPFFASRYSDIMFVSLI
jgi:hypothetical protein